MAAAQEAHQEDHQSFIKTPSQLVWVMVLAFVVPVIALILLAQFVLGSAKSVTETGMSDADIRARITPVASVALDLAGGAGGAKVEKSGEEVYKQVCSACHGTGAAGAHKFGDKAAWAPHIKEGLDDLAKNAINGIRGMPARGGNPDFTDLEVTRAVVYMANAAGANFKEPAAPAAKPAAAAAPAPAAGGARTGEQVYKLACSNCHATGANGAPRIDAAAEWRKRFGDKTPEAVLQSAIKGHGGMPSRGGFADLTDPEMLAAVMYMFQTAQGKQGAAPAPAVAASSGALPAKIYFDQGKAALTGEGKKAIADTAAVLKGGKDAVDITGYTDKTGNLALNLELAKDRAKAVRDALIVAGVAKDRINMKPPVETTGTGADKEARRVEIALAGKDAPTVAAAPAASAEAKGESTYKQACAACHAMGVAGAPKFGDKALWAPRIKTGMDALYTSSIKGKGAMPPKGGNVALADADVKAAVDYMVNAAK
jgi:cytochrome c5